ncbi:hypothetical protein ACFL42_00755 [Candidatus Omnitrophota bacterium]
MRKCRKCGAEHEDMFLTCTKCQARLSFKIDLSPAGIMLIGWAVTLSSVILLLPRLLRIFRFTLPLLARKIAMTFSLTPSILPSILVFLPVMLTFLILYIISLLAGIGILRLNNTARLIAVILSLISVAEEAVSGCSIVFGGGAGSILPQSGIVAVHIAYIIILTRPGVKRRFR